MKITRWPIPGARRSKTVAFGGTVYTVANASQASSGFQAQVAESLERLEAHLVEAGSARSHLLSLQVILQDISNRQAFDELWRTWIGVDPSHWPQRACFQGDLAPGLLIELVAVAARADAELGHAG